jgi:hypothetical protein
MISVDELFLESVKIGIIKEAKLGPYASAARVLKKHIIKPLGRGTKRAGKATAKGVGELALWSGGASVGTAAANKVFSGPKSSKELNKAAANIPRLMATGLKAGVLRGKRKLRTLANRKAHKATMAVSTNTKPSRLRKTFNAVKGPVASGAGMGFMFEGLAKGTAGGGKLDDNPSLNRG